MAEAFFTEDEDMLVPSELTRGPWDPDSQHAGPPAAAIGRALERHPGAEGHQIGRVTFEILRPVPIAPLQVGVRTVRGGRSVELLEALLTDPEGNELVRASCWRLATAQIELGGRLPAERPPPGPGEGEHKPFFPTGEEVGYHRAMEYRFVRGGFMEMGAATVWMRMLHPLVAGEEPTPLQRVLVAADTGNGVSAALDWRKYVFINTDLSVHLHRLPAGKWVCLDAVTRLEPNGLGLSDTAMYDEEGSIGRAAQTLFVRHRST
ncbi:MAG: thioesterase family protein [Actinomycetota bacterium]|nr:thioesterase family protein [Actinomycetota bacterium]